HSRRYLLSFPTRRSSDLILHRPGRDERLGGILPCNLIIHGTRAREDLTCGSAGGDLAILRDRRTNGHSCVQRSQSIGVGGCSLGDRKSTRLNSSHVKISY